MSKEQKRPLLSNAFTKLTVFPLMKRNKGKDNGRKS